MDTVESIAIVAGAALVLFVTWAGMNVLYFRRYTRHGYRPFAKPDTPRPRYAFSAEHSSRFRGGILIGITNATYPFATLELDENWASVTGTFSRDVWIERATVAEVAPVPGGIMFRSVDGAYDGLLFRCAPPIVLAAFLHHGWPVPAPDTAHPHGGARGRRVAE